MKFRKETQDDIVSILGEGAEMTGELSFNQGFRVDGIIRGKIRSESCLVVGATGRVEAEATVRKIAINGEFHGILRATDRIEIYKEGKVYGEVFTPCLIIEAGGLFDGKCNMSESRAPKAPAAPSGTSEPGTGGPRGSAAKD